MKNLLPLAHPYRSGTSGGVTSLRQSSERIAYNEYHCIVGGASPYVHAAKEQAGCDDQDDDVAHGALHVLQKTLAGLDSPDL